jgi:hypothetical protein
MKPKSGDEMTKLAKVAKVAKSAKDKAGQPRR